ncbi:hypothetical protein ACNHKD_03855 [Methylocystis sp. JAN1]|uniref:hypothetical protein n=1 Tax=Methylocystis sp. JAN1 TaxID=3397211 RepID=UPI003FA1DFD2
MPPRARLGLSFLLACALPAWATDRIAPPPAANLTPPHPTNSATGEALVPVGRNYVGARGGILYVPGGPKGVIDPLTGRFMPLRP